MVKFPLYIGLCKERVLWNHRCLFASHFCGWSVQHFSLEPTIVFFPIFHEITYYCTLLYDLTTNSLVFAENSFLLVFGLEGSQGDRFSKKSCLGHEQKCLETFPFFFDLQIYFPVIGTSCIPQNGDKYRVERKIKPYLRSFESCSALLVDTKTYLGKRLQKSP